MVEQSVRRGSGLRGFPCQTSPTCHSHIVSHISGIGTPSICLSVYLSIPINISPISAALPSECMFNISQIFLGYISQNIPNIFLNKSSAHSAKTVFPLLSQKHINIVFMPDMEIPGGKSAFIPVLFHTFASQSKSFERQIRNLYK